MLEKVVRLFGCLPVEDINKQETNEELQLEALQYGIYFSPVIVANYSKNELQQLLHNISINPQQYNNTFHKSFKTVLETPTLTLIIQQVLHYFTTYGLETVGLYHEDTVYIPVENLNIPEIKQDIPIKVIRGVTQAEFKNKVVSFMKKDVALSETTIADLKEIIEKYVDVTSSDIEQIANKEIRCLCFDMLNLVPNDPVEFLRLIVYKATGTSLLIKDNTTIDLLSTIDKSEIVKLFQVYIKENGIERLAEIFYRFKVLFLALRKNEPVLKKTINRIRRLAPKFHKPFVDDYLNQVTNYLRKNCLDLTKLQRSLDNVPVFRKVKLLRAIEYYTRAEAEYVSYNIRNGSTFIKSVFTPIKFNASRVKEIIRSSIINDIQPIVKGKTILIPEFIDYGIPSSEKQFIGPFPAGTVVTINKYAIVVGVHWFNLRKGRVDLDLSALSVGEKIGWDGSYKNSSVIFSGDMTDAPKPLGAAEALYVSKSENDYLLTLNFYNYTSLCSPVPFTFLITFSNTNLTTRDIDEVRDYIINPNNIVIQTQLEIEQRELCFGIVHDKGKSKQFFFYPVSSSKQMTAGNKFSKEKQHILKLQVQCRVSLNQILKEAGANIIAEPEKEQHVDIDLSPQNLSQSTLLELVNR